MPHLPPSRLGQGSGPVSASGSDGIDWLHMPSLSALRAFDAAAGLGGFSAAARALNVTPAAVAQQVRGLETELGRPLFARDGRGLALTPDGARLANAVAEGFRGIAAGVAALRRHEQGRGLKVTCTPTFSQTVLLPRMNAFWAANPEVPVALIPSDEVLDIARRGIDLAIRVYPHDHPDQQGELLIETRYVCVGAPSLVGDSGTPDFARLRWILEPKDLSEASWLRDLGLDPAQLDYFDAGSGPQAVVAAVYGYGITFASDIVVQPEIQAGRLRVLLFPDLPRLTYRTITPPGPVRPAVQAFVDWLRAELAVAPTRDRPAGSGQSEPLT